MQQDYHIDGFKFDAGDPERYPEKEVDVFDRQSYDTEQTYLWAKLGLEFPYNEFRACWKLGGQPLVQRPGRQEILMGRSGKSGTLNDSRPLCWDIRMPVPT